MQNELDILREVSERLESAGIAFVLTGSVAMNYYAQPRMTRDMDLVAALDEAMSEICSPCDAMLSICAARPRGVDELLAEVETTDAADE